MTKVNIFASAKASAFTQSITHGLEQIKIEDEGDHNVPTIDLTGLDDEQEGVDIIREVTPADSQTSGDLPFGCVLLDSADLSGETVQPGDSLELDDGDFLHNVRIFHDYTTSQDIVDGNLLKRTSRLNKGLKGMISTNHVNELCLVLRAPSTGKDPTLAKYRTVRALEDAICKRVIILTNKMFPAHSVHEYPYFRSTSLPIIRKEAQLVCRWRCTEETSDSGKTIRTGSLMRVREDECVDESFRASDVHLVNLFLKGKKQQEPHSHDGAVRADEHKIVDLVEEEVLVIPRPSLKRPYHSANDQIDLTADSDEDVKTTKRQFTDTIRRISSGGESVTKRKSSSAESAHKQPSITNRFAICKQQNSNEIFRRKSLRPQEPQNRSRILKYTFGDLCTGGGGMASGAKQAGLKMEFLLDHWDTACTTLNLNFNRSCENILLQAIFDFCTSDWDVEYVGVDVLHISFPCQPHSPAHTVEGKNDVDNIATGYSVIPILKKCKPRIVTFEQTSGIITHNGGVHFRALIRQITDSGYSVRWKICNLAKYGNVQPRNRLIIIGACPGEILPPFPGTTHGPGKLPFVTIYDVLRRIRNFDVPPNMSHYTPKSAQPYDARKPLQHCIKCDGSNPHPNGQRTFTLFELAALQGFPPTHRFFGTMTDIRKQIGNAVPSMFAKALFERIMLTLGESDRKRAAHKTEIVDLD
jgi:DNA (cytosine-5)-methyltransferase 1